MKIFNNTNSNGSRHYFSMFVAALGLAGLLSVPVVAYPGSDLDRPANVVKVSFDDLNLEQQSGAHALYVRLQRASKQACGVESYSVVRSARVVSEMQRCYREALAGSVKKIDDSQLTELHNS